MEISLYEKKLNELEKFISQGKRDKAFDLLYAGDANGDYICSAILGDYFTGSEDLEEFNYGMNFLVKAANHGIIEAMDTLGTIYYFGNDKVNCRPVEGLNYLIQAANGGYNPSAVKLSRIYLSKYLDSSALTDAQETFKWAQLGAKSGDPMAVEALAICLDDGIGTPRDPFAAVDCYEECLKNDPEDTFCMYRIAYILLDPDGAYNVLATQPMLEKAFEMAKKGAQLGDLDCHMMMGYFFLYGIMVPKNDNEAYRYFKLAADNGHQHSKDILQGFRRNIYGGYTYMLPL